MKIPKKNSYKEKCLEKKFVQPLRQRKKIRASMQTESTNSLEKKIRAEVKSIKKKSCRDMRLKKKFVPQKIYTPPPGISNGPPLSKRRSVRNFFRI